MAPSTASRRASERVARASVVSVRRTLLQRANDASCELRVRRRDAGLVDETARVETVIQATEHQQLLVRALFHDATAVQDEDAVRALDGGEAVGDHDRGPAAHEAVEGLLDEEFALVVE